MGLKFFTSGSGHNVMNGRTKFFTNGFSNDADGNNVWNSWNIISTSSGVIKKCKMRIIQKCIYVCMYVICD